MNNNELFEKVKAAQSPEEITEVMRANGMEEFSDDTAKKYYDFMHMKSGEISDEELENAAGGCKTKGHTTVTCDHKCHCGKYQLVYRDGKRMRSDNSGLRDLWEYMTIGSSNPNPAAVDSKCGYCYFLGFSAGTGYCEIS